MILAWYQQYDTTQVMTQPERSPIWLPLVIWGIYLQEDYIESNTNVTAYHGYGSIVVWCGLVLVWWCSVMDMVL